MRITALIEDMGLEMLMLSPCKVDSLQVPQGVMGDTLETFNTGTTIEV